MVEKKKPHCVVLACIRPWNVFDNDFSLTYPQLDHWSFLPRTMVSSRLGSSTDPLCDMRMHTRRNWGSYVAICGEGVATGEMKTGAETHG